MLLCVRIAYKCLALAVSEAGRYLFRNEYLAMITVTRTERHNDQICR